MKIVCIGKNYQKHADEMKSDVPEEPMFFIKPETALVPKGSRVPYPSFTEDLHYELELAVKIGETAQRLNAESSLKHVESWGLGIDFTARDIQSGLKEKGYPWEKSKAFDGSAFVGSTFLSTRDLKQPDNISFALNKNGKQVQSGSSDRMIFSVSALLEHVTQYVTLRPGDLLFTGTPEGVGPVEPGDELAGFLEERKLLSCKIAGNSTH